MEIDNYQWKVFMLNISQIELILAEIQSIYVFHLYISDDNKQDACNINTNMFHIIKHIYESGILVPSMSTLLE